MSFAVIPDSCVICGQASSALEKESFRPTLTLELAMTKLCEALFVPTYRLHQILEIMQKDNLYCQMCLSTINVALKIQDQITRLESTLREKAEVISNAIKETHRIAEGDGKGCNGRNEKSTLSPWKNLQNTILRNYAKTILPMRPAGRKKVLCGGGLSIPVAAVIPMPQVGLPPMIQDPSKHESSTSANFAKANKTIDASVLLGKKREEKDNEGLFEKKKHLVKENKQSKPSSDPSRKLVKPKQPVKRKLFVGGQDQQKKKNKPFVSSPQPHSDESSPPTEFVTLPVPSNSDGNSDSLLDTDNTDSCSSDRRLSTRLRNVPKLPKKSTEPQPLTNPASEPSREVKKCPKCDFKMHLSSPSDLLSNKGRERRKKVELMIFDHYGKHHLSVKPHNVSITEDERPSYICPTCKFQALPPSTIRSRIPLEPAEAKRQAYRALIQHYLITHEIY